MHIITNAKKIQVLFITFLYMFRRVSSSCDALPRPYIAWFSICSHTQTHIQTHTWTKFKLFINILPKHDGESWLATKPRNNPATALLCPAQHMQPRPLMTLVFLQASRGHRAHSVGGGDSSTPRAHFSSAACKCYLSVMAAPNTDLFPRRVGALEANVTWDCERPWCRRRSWTENGTGTWRDSESRKRKHGYEDCREAGGLTQFSWQNY